MFLCSCKHFHPHPPHLHTYKHILSLSLLSTSHRLPPFPYVSSSVCSLLVPVPCRAPLPCLLALSRLIHCLTAYLSVYLSLFRTSPSHLHVSPSCLIIPTFNPCVTSYSLLLLCSFIFILIFVCPFISSSTAFSLMHCLPHSLPHIPPRLIPPSHLPCYNSLPHVFSLSLCLTLSLILPFSPCLSFISLSAHFLPPSLLLSTWNSHPENLSPSFLSPSLYTSLFSTSTSVHRSLSPQSQLISRSVRQGKQQLAYPSLLQFFISLPQHCWPIPSSLPFLPSFLPLSLPHLPSSLPLSLAHLFSSIPLALPHLPCSLPLSLTSLPPFPIRSIKGRERVVNGKADWLMGRED